MNLPVFRSPHYAVDGFMILSGFLLTYHALLRSSQEPWTKSDTWVAFYIRRYFRISPLYYLLLIPSYLLSDSALRWRTTTDRMLALPRPLESIQHFSPQHLLMHLTYLFGLLPSYHTSTVMPDWSLSLEMQFYLVFPVFMLLVLRFGWLLFSLSASAIWLVSNVYAPHLSLRFVQPSPLPLSLLWFLIGMLWASAYLEPDGTQRLRKALLATSLSLLSRDPHDIVLVVVFAWILFAQGSLTLGPSASVVCRALSGNCGNFLARASYSVYLLHLLVLTPAAYLLCTRFQLSIASRFTFALAITVIVSYGLAKPLEIIEDLGIAEGKRLSKKVMRAASYRTTPQARASFLPDANPIDI